MLIERLTNEYAALFLAYNAYLHITLKCAFFGNYSEIYNYKRQYIVYEKTKPDQKKL